MPVPESEVNHGRNLYTHGCRCDVCRMGQAAYAREYRARRRPLRLKVQRAGGCPNPTLWSVRRFAEALDCDVVLVPRSPAPEVTDEMAGVRPRKGRAVQEEALHLSGRGLSASVIAGRLGVSSRTVVRWRTEANRRRSEDAA